jgi:hypothetical protein
LPWPHTGPAMPCSRVAPLSGTAGGAILLCLPRRSTRKDRGRHEGSRWAPRCAGRRTPRTAHRDPGGQSGRNPVPGLPNRLASCTDPVNTPGRACSVPDSAITTCPQTNGSRRRHASVQCP